MRARLSTVEIIGLDARQRPQRSGDPRRRRSRRVANRPARSFRWPANFSRCAVELRLEAGVLAHAGRECVCCWPITSWSNSLTRPSSSRRCESITNAATGPATITSAASAAAVARAGFRFVHRHSRCETRQRPGENRLALQEPSQFGGHRAGAAIATIRVALQALQANRGEVARNVSVQLARIGASSSSLLDSCTSKLPRYGNSPVAN